MGSLYYQAPLIPVIKIAKIFHWKNTVDFMGIANAGQPSLLQKLTYSSMYSMVGVASNNLIKYLFYHHGDVTRDVTRSTLQHFFTRFDGIMLQKGNFVDEEE
jgi:hypothetical protein